MGKINKYSVASAISLSALSLVSVSAFAQVPTVNIAPPTAIGTVDTDINNLIAFVINAIIVIGVILSLIFLLWGGIRWVTSGGDKAKVDTARGTIVAAIVGLIIVILAYVIINAVLQITTGKSLNQGFEIPQLSNSNSGTP